MTTESGPPNDASPASLWRWPMAFLLVCGFALLTHAVPLDDISLHDASAHTAPLADAPDERRDHNLTNSGPVWALAGPQQLLGPVPRTPAPGYPGDDAPSAALVGVLPTETLLVIVLLAGLCCYLRFQVHLVFSSTHTEPCSPRAPPAP